MHYSRSKNSLSLALTHTHTLTCINILVWVKKKWECSYFLTACLPNSFQLLLGWESCYGNTPNTKSNMGLISEWTQSCKYKAEQGDEAQCPKGKWLWILLLEALLVCVCECVFMYIYSLCITTYKFTFYSYNPKNKWNVYYCITRYVNYNWFNWNPSTPCSVQSHLWCLECDSE